MQAFEVQVELFEALLSEKSVGAPSSRITNFVLEQAMSQVHIRADELLRPHDLLSEVLAKKEDEFKIEAGDILACETSAGRMALAAV